MHVAFLRSRLGPRAIRPSREMRAIVAQSLTWGVPSLGRLGCPFEKLMRRIQSRASSRPKSTGSSIAGFPRAISPPEEPGLAPFQTHWSRRRPCG